MRFVVSATTPGEMVVWRGMFALWDPHGQIHLVWLPVSDLIEHPALRSARSSSSRLIGFGTTLY